MAKLNKNLKLMLKTSDFSENFLLIAYSVKYTR